MKNMTIGWSSIFYLEGGKNAYFYNFRGQSDRKNIVEGGSEIHPYYHDATVAIMSFLVLQVRSTKHLPNLYVYIVGWLCLGLGSFPHLTFSPISYHIIGFNILEQIRSIRQRESCLI